MASFHDDGVAIEGPYPTGRLPRTRAPRTRAHQLLDARQLRPAAAVLALVLSAASVARFGLTLDGAVAVAFVSVLTALSVIDIEQRRLPNRIVLPAAVTMLAVHIALYPERALEWVLAAFGAALFLVLPLLVNPAGIGMGDVKLALLLGAGLGATVAAALVLALVSAGFFSLVLVARYGLSARGRTIAFGPFLSGGAIAALLIL